jgi:hypothetical protein
MTTTTPPPEHDEHRPSPTVVCVFRARFDADCDECGRMIVAGRDWVCELTNGAYVHETCTW